MTVTHRAGRAGGARRPVAAQRLAVGRAGVGAERGCRCRGSFTALELSRPQIGRRARAPGSARAGPSASSTRAPGSRSAPSSAPRARAGRGQRLGRVAAGSGGRAGRRGLQLAGGAQLGIARQDRRAQRARAVGRRQLDRGLGAPARPARRRTPPRPAAPTGRGPARRSRDRGRRPARCAAQQPRAEAVDRGDERALGGPGLSRRTELGQPRAGCGRAARPPPSR